MICDVCGLPDNYRGWGDGIGSCDCPRCPCGVAGGSDFCVCRDHDDEPDDDWDDDDEPWPDDVILRPIVTVELDGISR